MKCSTKSLKKISTTSSVVRYSQVVSVFILHVGFKLHILTLLLTLYLLLNHSNITNCISPS